MKIVLISLARASVRRFRMKEEFDAVGLEYTIKDAIDGATLTDAHRAHVDWETRRRLGHAPQARGSIANWLTQREVMAEMVENGPDMLAIFEDDARLSPAVPDVLDALAAKRFDFDVVSMYQGPKHRPFVAGVPLIEGHAIGRLKVTGHYEPWLRYRAQCGGGLW